MEPVYVESPTLRSLPFSLLPVTPISAFDIEDDLSSQDMDNDSSGSSKTAIGRHQEPDEGFFDLQPPISHANNVKIEDVMTRLNSVEHLNFILDDQTLFYRFSAFLNRYHSHMIPTLVRYLEMRKAIKAIEFANAVAKGIRWPSHTDTAKFSRIQAGSVDIRFEDYAARELLLLCSEALPAFVTYTLIEVVADCVSKDITNQAIPVIRDLVGNLGEVFCLTDPSLHDNPIIYASEEFHKTTQYGTSYAIDRNCRFLQGPATDKNTTMRITRAISLGRECNELLLNYRRDGTPFINLLMCSPLHDDRGAVRYFVGAQIDVTGLIEEGMGIESFRALLQKDKQPEDSDRASTRTRQFESNRSKNVKDTLDRLQELSMMFSQDESDVVSKYNRSDDSTDAGSIRSCVPTSVKNRSQAKRVIGIEEILGEGLNLSQLSLGTHNSASHGLPGAYQHYLLVRPDPSLQIIFVSPSLRLPGLLRTHLFSKLGGPAQVISALQAAFRDGAAVTAKVLWFPRNASKGEMGRAGHAEAKPRWIRCTPLLGSDDRVGVWMVILVPLEDQSIKTYRKRQHVVHMVDEVELERKKFETMSMAGSKTRSRTPSRSGSIPNENGGGLPKFRTRTISRSGGGDGKNLYADYLRSSSPVMPRD